MASITSEHLDFAASCLGTSILSANPTQILIESNDTFIHRFSIHELNRNVDPTWVAQMKVELLKTIMAKECMTLTLAIDKRHIALAMDEPDTTTEYGGFKAIILDGQHRWEAMKQIKEELSHHSPTFKIWLVVYVVENDAEILQRLETLNKRRQFTESDNDKVAVMQRFLEAFAQIHSTEQQTRRCIIRVRRSPILQSDAFILKHKYTTTEQFHNRILKIAQIYHETWLGIKKHTKPNVLTFVIEKTHLYQLVDEKENWIKDV